MLFFPSRVNLGSLCSEISNSRLFCRLYASPCARVNGGRSVTIIATQHTPRKHQHSATVVRTLYRMYTSSDRINCHFNRRYTQS